MKDPIPPEHYYVPQAENDPVKAEVVRIFEEATEAVKGGGLTVEQIREALDRHIERVLNENFTSLYAQPAVIVDPTWVDKRPVFVVSAFVYGHEFNAIIS